MVCGNRTEGCIYTGSKAHLKSECRDKDGKWLHPEHRVEKPNEPALTVGALVALLLTMDQDQKPVFSDIYYGDFDLTGFTGGRLSEDNFMKDLRPILRLQKRR